MYSALHHLPSIFWKRRPIQLTYFVTRRCNAFCPYCFYRESNDTPADSGEELTLEEISRVARSLGRLLWLAFSGGEIYLRKDLVDISRVFYTTNKPTIMLYPTNGQMPDLIRNKTEQILAACPQSVVVVKLSIDELGERHDRLRNTPHSFEKTLETHRLLSPLLGHYPNFELGVNTVFCSENQERMDEIIDFVASLSQVGTHTISMVRGDLKDPRYKAIDLEKYSHAVQRLADAMKDKAANIYRFKGASIKAAQDVLQRQLIQRTLKDQRRQIPCYAGRINLVLSETGEVHPCELLSDSFGNVRDHDYDLGKVLRSSPAKQSLAAIKAEQCYCTHECNFMTNILFNPRLYPSLTREYVNITSR